MLKLLLILWFYMDTETRHFRGALAWQAGPPFSIFYFTFFSIVVLKITGSLKKKTNNKMLNSTNVQIS